MKAFFKGRTWFQDTLANARSVQYKKQVFDVFIIDSTHVRIKIFNMNNAITLLSLVKVLLLLLTVGPRSPYYSL